MALNPKQERFCTLYATDREFFGNGVESYLEVYDVDRGKPNWYKTACSAASRLLSDVKVIERINQQLEATGLNDAFMDKQLVFLATQHSDFSSKLGALREYNKLKARITEKSESKVIFPKPILGGVSVSSYDSNEEDSQSQKES